MFSLCIRLSIRFLRWEYRVADGGRGPSPMASPVGNYGEAYAERDAGPDGGADGAPLGEFLSGQLVQREKEDDVTGHRRGEQSVVHIEKTVSKPREDDSSEGEDDGRGMQVGE